MSGRAPTGVATCRRSTALRLSNATTSGWADGRSDGPAVRPRYDGDGPSGARATTSGWADERMGVATGLRCVRCVRGTATTSGWADGRSDGPAVRPGASEVRR